MLESQIEIAAPPSQVKAVLLDNTKYLEWHTAFVKKIEAAEDASQPLASLRPGDKINCDMDGMKFTAAVVENSETCFAWQGPPVFGLIAGLHSFHTEPINGGASTLFKQTEAFTGVISFAMGPKLLGKKMLGQYDQFNLDLKTRVESLKV